MSPIGVDNNPRSPLIIRAKVLGFCMGVLRAVELAGEAIEQSAGTVYTLGPLIHNPQVLEDLSRRGVKILNEDQLFVPDLRSTVIIRAHGVGPQTEAELCKRGAAVIDATCPRVKASQLKAAAYAKAGYRLFLAGEETHAEVIGIKDYFLSNLFPRNRERAPDTVLREWGCIIVSNAAEAEEAAAKLHAEDGALLRSDAKTALIGQTTISAEEYRDIGSAINCFFPGLEIAQTICAATRERQDSLRELLESVDALIIAGGKDSANTRRLLAIAESSGKPCALVESPADIPPDFFRFETVGVTAGASTPDSVIEGIVDKYGSL